MSSFSHVYRLAPILLSSLVAFSTPAHAAGKMAEPLPVAQNFKLDQIEGNWTEVASYQSSRLHRAARTWSKASGVSISPDPDSAAGGVWVAKFQTERLFGEEALEGSLYPANTDDPARLVFRSLLPPYKHTYFAVLKVADDGSYMLFGDEAREHAYIYAKHSQSLPVDTLRYIIDALRDDYGYADIEEHISCTTQPDGLDKACDNLLKG